MLEKKVVKLVTVLLISCMVLMCTALFYLPEVRKNAGPFFNKKDNDKSTIDKLFGDEAVLVPSDAEVVEAGLDSLEDVKSNRRLAFMLPDGVKATDVKISNDYLHQTVNLVIPSADEEYFENRPLAGSSNYIEEISTDPGPIQGIVEIRTDKVYELAKEEADSKLKTMEGRLLSLRTSYARMYQSQLKSIGQLLDYNYSNAKHQIEIYKTK